MTIKLYSLEYRNTFYGEQWRWRSMYNHAKGAWTYIKGDAISGGEKHEQIILMFHGPKKQVDY